MRLPGEYTGVSAIKYIIGLILWCLGAVSLYGLWLIGADIYDWVVGIVEAQQLNPADRNSYAVDTQTGGSQMQNDLVSTLVDLGGTLGSLLACFWYIQFLTKEHAKERQLWMDKDTESDRALREIQQDSNRILTDLKGVMIEQTTLLKQVLALEETVLNKKR